ncbi:uncharacterized protein LOC128020238 isoform X5 [Carassius gibelio]|uniref:uncharacterized protein LOC128020238 isoform X4 n=1 Tax=Carassius gibelio TaxID=101364 RepID=UPI0022799EF3|nr:uncharacterized protein LOC128020238 isoform X4 [Carassius gibelio]XP_052463012.1 uncharacterized protein LOC128020238 isoform X5 [Carassius gibelio]
MRFSLFEMLGPCLCWSPPTDRDMNNKRSACATQTQILHSARIRHRMVRLRTLNELSHLRETGFGQPYPRHGLSLLWWFADDCVEIDDDGNMIARYDPEHRDFGFHPFHNSEGILPDNDLPYYEMGNLRHPGMLPHDVTKNYDRNVRGVSMRNPPSASAKASLRSFRGWTGQISSRR